MSQLNAEYWALGEGKRRIKDWTSYTDDQCRKMRVMGTKQVPGQPAAYYPIDPDAPMFGCNRLGHSWDTHGDCRHCPASMEDLEPGRDLTGV
jgi:hypothetical protein